MTSLFVMRHGKAKEEDPRPINEEGRIETGRIAEMLVDQNIRFDYIFHSTKQRSKDTALIVNQLTGSDAVMKETSLLYPTEDPQKIFTEIDDLEGKILLVGHLPYVANFSGLLTSGNTSNQPVSFEPSTIMKITKTNGFWAINWVVPPVLVK